ncbi:Protein of unknown function, partial [Gryllus bimaculatus]
MRGKVTYIFIWSYISRITAPCVKEPECKLHESFTNENLGSFLCNEFSPERLNEIYVLNVEIHYLIKHTLFSWCETI